MVLELTDDNYTQTVETTDTPIFIDFYSPTCGPCQALLPLLPKLAEHFGGDVLIAKVNVAQNPKLAAKYEIRSVPFCVAIGSDKIVKDYELGAAPAERYIRMIKKAQGKGFFARLFGG
jgi:thioredoxin 1